MFEKVTKFRMLPVRRSVPNLRVPANDNRWTAVRGAAWRAHAPRLICRWELGEGANRPICRWELDSSDEPSPSLRRVPQPGLGFHKTGLHKTGLHKTVLQPSYLGGRVGVVHGADFTSAPNAPLRKTKARSDPRSCCMHVTGRCDLAALPAGLLPIASGLQ